MIHTDRDTFIKARNEWKEQREFLKKRRDFLGQYKSRKLSIEETKEVANSVAHDPLLPEDLRKIFIKLIEEYPDNLIQLMDNLLSDFESNKK